MSIRLSFLLLGLCAWLPAWCPAEYPDPYARELTLLVRAGAHDRVDVPVSVLVPVPEARSVWILREDGGFERAGVVEPGIEHPEDRRQAHKELFFNVSNLKKGETGKLVAKLSPRPVEHRGYVWSGEPRRSRVLSCAPCHQGLALPTAAELRREREVMALTGKPPPLPAFTPLPTTNGKDFRRHEKLGVFQHSACYECHGRQFVEYRFGQTLDSRTPWAPETGAGPAEHPSVYHRVFRVKGDRPLAAAPRGPGAGPPAGIHFGLGSGMRQRHVRILSEEANKFVGRQCVLVEWLDGAGRVRATEERQLTVKNVRAANGSLALWIDCVSLLRPAGSAADGPAGTEIAGWRFIFGSDDGTGVAYRQGSGWQAAAFTSEGQPHTAACFVSPGGAPPALRKDGDAGDGIGFDLPTQLSGGRAQTVHCRLWLQGGEMPDSEIRRMADDFQDPVQVEPEKS